MLETRIQYCPRGHQVTEKVLSNFSFRIVDIHSWEYFVRARLMLTYIRACVYNYIYVSHDWWMQRQTNIHKHTHVCLSLSPSIMVQFTVVLISLQWRHNEHDGVPNHQRLDCLLNRSFRRRSNQRKPKIGVTGHCEGNPSLTIGFPSQRTSDAENVSIWWRHLYRNDVLVAWTSVHGIVGNKLQNCAWLWQ